MATKLVTAFASMLSIGSILALTLMVQGWVMSVDRKKGAWEAGDSLKKWGCFILIAGALVGFFGSSFGLRSEVVQFGVAASIAGGTTWISGQCLVENDRGNLAKSLLNHARTITIFTILFLVAMLVSWAFSVDP